MKSVNCEGTIANVRVHVSLDLEFERFALPLYTVDVGGLHTVPVFFLCSGYVAALTSGARAAVRASGKLARGSPGAIPGFPRPLTHETGGRAPVWWVSCRRGTGARSCERVAGRGHFARNNYAIGKLRYIRLCGNNAILHAFECPRPCFTMLYNAL